MAVEDLKSYIMQPSYRRSPIGGSTIEFMMLVKRAAFKMNRTLTC